MISFTHITYSVWVPNDGLPGFDDRLFVFDLYPLHSCSYHRFLFFFFFFELAYKLSTRMDLKPILIDL
jgi:hypothetical protein